MIDIKIFQRDLKKNHMSTPRGFITNFFGDKTPSDLVEQNGITFEPQDQF